MNESNFFKLKHKDLDNILPENFEKKGVFKEIHRRTVVEKCIG